VPALRRVSARQLVQLAVVRAQQLQLFEISNPRRYLTQRAEISELRGTLFTKLFKPKPRRRHRVAHRTAHRREPGEIGGVAEMLRSENVRDDDVVEKAGDRVLRVGKACGSSDSRDITARVSHGGMRCVGGHVKGARRCASFRPRKGV